MRERLITLACALGALGLFLALFVRSAGGVSGPAESRPTTADRGGNGYLAAMQWLAGEGIRSRSLRERWDRLAGMPGLPPRGNLLIVTLPGAIAYRNGELRALQAWVRRGNTLLVLAALADDPDWASGGLRPAPGDLDLLTGLTIEPLPARHAAAVPLQRAALVPSRPDAYFEGVRQAVALSEHPWQPWRVKVPRDGFVLSLASQKEAGAGGFWVRSAGAGRILVSAFGSLFTARVLGLAGNARLLANIVASTVGPHGVVLFDDAHQGLGDAYDPARFYSDPRLYWTVAVLAAVWLSWVLGSTRLRVPHARTVVPGEADLVRATGGWLARVVSPAAAAQGLVDHFLRRARPGGGCASAWEALEQDPRIARADLKQLKTWDQAARAGGRVPLERLHHLILRIEQQLGA